MAGKRKSRRYTDEFRATSLAALAANGNNIVLTAKQLDVPQDTLRRWANGTRHPECRQASIEKKEQLAASLEKVAWQLADAIPEKLASATLQQLAVALGIVIDKMRLLRNEPTEIQRTEGHGAEDLSKLTDDELAERIKTLRAQAEQARSA